jgi:hypothetical protein
MVIRDLSSEFDGVNFNTMPLSFCGKKHIHFRHLRVCAEYFLASLRDIKGDNQKGVTDQQVKLYAFPKIKAYGRCMLAPTDYQIKACIQEVTASLTTADLIHQTRTGSTGADTDDKLDAIALRTMADAQPESNLQGLNGGVDAQAAEIASKPYGSTHAFPVVPIPRCTNLGFGGCDEPPASAIKKNLKKFGMATLEGPTKHRDGEVGYEFDENFPVNDFYVDDTSR